MSAIRLDREASRTRDYCVAKDATHPAARPGPSAGKSARLRMTMLFANEL